MITENPGFFLTDGCGGRTMGDTTTIWLLEILEIYQSTGNLTRLKEVWPAAVKGIQWQIQVSQEFGIPAHLVCTYDILSMEQRVIKQYLRLSAIARQPLISLPLFFYLSPFLPIFLLLCSYNSTTFNGVLHIAAMAAGEVLAAVMGDNATATAAATSRATAVSVMTSPVMWNSSLGFFRAYIGGNAIMSDCLYGQQVALAHGLGWLLPKDLIAQHLAAELKYNANPYGLTVVKGRNEPLVTPSPSPAPKGMDSIASQKTARAADIRSLMQNLRSRGDGQDDSIWMGSGPTWSCLSLALGEDGPSGGNVTAALEPTRWILSNYRDRLKSMWDLTGLSTTDDWADAGQPFCTSHYGKFSVRIFDAPTSFFLTSPPPFFFSPP